MGRWAGIALLSLLIAMLALAGAIAPSSHAIAADGPLIVTSTLDAVDDAPGDGLCNAAGDICTLRAAVQEANASVGPDTIVLAAETYVLTLEGAGEDAAATGDLDITETVAIVGDDAATTVIDGGDLDRIFHVLTTDVVSISGTTIQNGYAGRGGGIANESGQLTLDSITVQGNESEAGGGIWNAGGLTVSSSSIRDNQASDSSGGGIQTETGAVSLTDVVVESNDAFVQGGGIIAFGGQITMTGGSVSHNGALFAGGGGILAFAATVTLIDVDVIGNNGDGAAFSGPDAQAGGIGIYDGSLEILDSHVEGNYVYGSGGGIFVQDSSFTIDGGTVSGNTARFGGGIHGSGSISNVSIASNYVEATLGEGGVGGGIYGGGTLVNVTIGGNVVETGGEFSERYAARGTAIYGSAALVNVTIADNATATVFGPDAAPASPIYATGAMELANTIVADASLLGCAGAPVTSLGHNLDRGATCGLSAVGDRSNVEPLLGPLADNGGLSPTHALLPGSPAIDAGDDARCPPADQRALPRPVDGNGDGAAVCDIGAYEVQDIVVAPDTTAPTIAPEVTGPLGLDGWYVGDVTVSWSVIDNESAVSATDGCDETTITNDTAGTTLTCLATSAGGTAQQSVTIKRDTTAPVIAATTDIRATATSRTGAHVSYSAPAYEDNLSGSGIAACELRSGRRFKLGESTVTCSATDAAGNTAQSSFRVFVTYDWSGLRPPIKANGTTVAKAGSTIPLKFRLTGASSNITNAAATLSVERLADGYRPIRVARFEYNGDYMYHWKTKGLAPGKYLLTIDLGDGDTSRTVMVRLR